MLIFVDKSFDYNALVSIVKMVSDQFPILYMVQGPDIEIKREK